MDDYQVALGKPDRLPVEHLGDKNQKQRKQHPPKDDESKKKKLLSGEDEIILSSDAESLQKVDKTSEKTKTPDPEKSKGTHIDLTA